MRLLSFLTLSLFFIASVSVAKPQTQTCQSASESPAHDLTKTALAQLKDAYMFLLGALINENPTHDEMVGATSWQLDNVEQTCVSAAAKISEDTNALRREFYRVKLDFVRLNVKAARGLIKMGIPSWPWLGKFYNWATKFWGDLKEAWRKFFHLQQKKGVSVSENVAEGVFDRGQQSMPQSEEEVRKGREFGDNLSGILDQVEVQAKQLETKTFCS